MRQLASIKRVGDIFPIEGRDRIVLAMIDGWSVIVKKDEFQTGDLCVYCEIDSVFPEREEFEFLRSKNFRIKTMKMAGVVSQGICFPLSILPDGKYELGQDVTDILGVTQYEPTMDKEPELKNAKKPKYPKWLMRQKWFRNLVKRRSGGKESRGFPSFIQKTDQTRLQNMPFILKTKDPFVATEKVDGQSGTFVLVRHKKLFGTKFEYIVCSRNLRLFTKDNSSYWSVSDKYNIRKVLEDIIADNEWVAIQGECISPKVQGNKYMVDEPDLYVFDVITPAGKMDTMLAKALVEEHGMKFVPIIATDYVLPDTVQEVLDYAHGDSALGHTIREGIVFRAPGGKVSFKAVDPLFLIKYDA